MASPPHEATTVAGAPPAPPSPARVLVVDDEKNIRRTLELVLAGEGYQVTEAGSAEDALAILANPESPVDLAIFDLKLPGMSGLDALERLRKDEATQQIPVIVISGHATVQDAVHAIKLGAADFFEKPLNRERVLVSVQNVIRAAKLSEAMAGLREEIEARYEMIGASAPMQKLFKEIDKVAPTRASVLITGESGTGKELISRAIHRLSPRKEAPFVKVNCAAIPRELIESELFGHERGAFTGAQARRRGLFEQAHGGTLFLDEIGDMDLSAQAKVLRALQSGEVNRVGSEHVIRVDVRVLAATNKDLERATAGGRFREDLFFRLNVFPIRSPALRERVEDIRALADAFVTTFCKENGMRKKPIDDMVLKALERRAWPGNVRELKNVVERAAILSGELITIADLPEDPHANPFDDEAAASGDEAENLTPEPGIVTEPGRGMAQASDGAELGKKSGTAGVIELSSTAKDTGERLMLRDFRELAERRFIVATLAEMDWNISRTAVALGIERTNLHKKIRAYGVKRGET